MSIHAALTHRTTYRYERPVRIGPQVIRLRPAPHARTPILSYSLKVEPAEHFLNWQQDPQGNFQARVVFPEKVKEFTVTVDLVADMAVINPFDFFLEPEAEKFPFSYDTVLSEELAPFRKQAPAGPRLRSLLDEVAPRGGEATVDFLWRINQAVQGRIAYIVRMEPGVWEPERALDEGRGSCRDSAWLLVQALRHLGFAARFCSGYLIQLVADVKPVEGPEGPSADFTDLHAWAEVYLPGAGWVGLDATSGLFAGEGHIPLASTPEPQSAAPISGLVEKAEVEFGFEMQIRRIEDRPRVTKPYTPEQSAAIAAMGREVDRALARQDVRLSMGGEPTFVAASDREAAEWNTDALGPTKRLYAQKLIRRLAPLWAPGFVLHTGQGKQYPGEPLPRFALSCHWRRDGEAIWREPGLLASDGTPGGATPKDAARFAERLAERLQVPPELVRDAHEDVHYYLWRENRLPANVAAEDSKLLDPLERARFARLFRGGLGPAVGSVLPLRRVRMNGDRRWQSGRWFFRDDTLFLTPGDSPMGLRLPLASLPWLSPEDLAMEGPFEPDPFAPKRPLPLLSQLRASVSGVDQPLNVRPVLQPPPEAGMNDPALVRTALCVEPRDGKLHIFCPPVFDAEDWLSLLAAIEATAEESARPVVIEGYLPPEDDRLNNFSVTPDPGVIEANIHPAHSWTEMEQRTTQLYEEARQVGLATEKFMLDGRHVGTGGGNHVVMGGATVEDSPFLRRPDLLRSLVSFWHNHPSLSFLFSGLFIGPTSQHPRVDEARMDAIREMEIAFRELDRVRAGGPVPPWLTDRLFRNLLADMTGNTHRTEFCIDKMYDPNGPGGRRGLVEFRAFEMPPHAEMSLSQMLLMRAAVAAFWGQPYRRSLVRWGTALHDRFMLPHHAEEDFRGALEEIGQMGFAFDPAWFAPHFEFRFPRLGMVEAAGMELELRHALEPWHVLGEETGGGGTVRYVDSSVERVQARVSNWVPERYTLAANGAAVPLHPTGRAGEFVAGIRFKAWDPPSALHPTVRAQTPLVLDVHDAWSGRAVAGLTYHVSHPGGRNYQTFPVNANEAEARRRARFFAHGHTPGPTPRPVPAPSLEHPCTLDLRAHVS